MKHPYQCIDLCETKWCKRLVAASGPRILTFDLEAGELLSTWPPHQTSDTVIADEAKNESEEPPEKKRKISESEDSVSNITILRAAPDGEHFVAVTGDDKCVRVFEFDRNSHIRQLSSRCMPKRPCAITFTPDSKTILCGDKFGDVYALPLLPTSEELQAPVNAETPVKEEPKSFTPSATTLTVHSGRNRRALEMQQKGGQPVKPKQSLAFAHELLLGHVSMLTDIAFVTDQEILVGETRPRSYILTSDRDEHIRISRGPPQAHIIEGFCLGHKEFVNKIAIINSNTIISGGGDDYLLVWNLEKREVRRKVELRPAVIDALKRLPDQNQDYLRDKKIAVSGIWTLSQDCALQEGTAAIILIAVEGVPALFSYAAERNDYDMKDSNWSLELDDPKLDGHLQTIPLGGNVLDVALWGRRLLVSIDNVHVPGSTERIREDKDEIARTYFLTAGTGSSTGFRFVQWEVAKELPAPLHTMNDAAEFEVKEGASIKDLLYGVENLRKRGGTEEE